MKRVLSLLLAVVGALSLAMAKKSELAVRFFAEANAQDTDRFATPIHFQNPPREAYIERVPVINERMIKAIYPFQAANGTWGCGFKLDESGRLALEVLTTSRRGTSVVAFIATKFATHQVVDMQVDRPVKDGLISIPYGLTEGEITTLTTQYPIVGEKKPRKK